MKIVQQKLQDFGYVCVENLYTNKELHHIKNEIQNMNYILDSVPAIQERRDKDSAKDEDGSNKMTGNGMMLDALYAQREYSSLLTFNRKIFASPIEEKFIDLGINFVAPFAFVNGSNAIIKRY